MSKKARKRLIGFEVLLSQDGTPSTATAFLVGDTDGHGAAALSLSHDTQRKMVSRFQAEMRKAKTASERDWLICSIVGETWTMAQQITEQMLHAVQSGKRSGPREKTLAMNEMLVTHLGKMTGVTQEDRIHQLAEEYAKPRRTGKWSWKQEIEPFGHAAGSEPITARRIRDAVYPVKPKPR